MVMIEGVKRINNPLTVIGIFAAIAEVSMTVALGFLTPTLLNIFIWFVMLFPVLLVVLFFLTLNFNHAVLYAPSDFKNEENFMAVARMGTRLTASSRQVGEQLDIAESVIMSELNARGSQSKEIAGIINEQIALIRDKIETSREAVIDAFLVIAPESRDRRALEIISEIKKAGVTRSADAEKSFVRVYVDRFGLEDYLADHEVDRALVRSLLRQTLRAGEFLDNVSRGTSLSFLAMEAITSLYLLDDPSLRTAYEMARQRAFSG